MAAVEQNSVGSRVSVLPGSASCLIQLLLELRHCRLELPNLLHGLPLPGQGLAALSCPVLPCPVFPCSALPWPALLCLALPWPSLA